MPFLRTTAVLALVIVSLRRIVAVLALGGAGVMPFLGVAAVLALGVHHASFLVLPAYRLKSLTYCWVYCEVRTGTREERQRKEEVGLRQEEGGEEEERSEE